MSRVITFSRTYPSYHPKAGQRTYFVEKILNSLFSLNGLGYSYKDLCGLNPNIVPWELFKSLERSEEGLKHHTIRAGHRWKVGDWFSPRVWSGVPYNSKQITFAPDIQIKKIWNFNIDECGVMSLGDVGKQDYYLQEGQDKIIAENDGLELMDFYWWFNKYPLVAQIISWNENIEY